MGDDIDTETSASQRQIPVIAERFALGVFVGAATVSVFQLENWWAASLAFMAFVLFLLFRWERLVRNSPIDD